MPLSKNSAVLNSRCSTAGFQANQARWKLSREGFFEALSSIHTRLKVFLAKSIPNVVRFLMWLLLPLKLVFNKSTLAHCEEEPISFVRTKFEWSCIYQWGGIFFLGFFAIAYDSDKISGYTVKGKIEDTCACCRSVCPLPSRRKRRRTAQKSIAFSAMLF